MVLHWPHVLAKSPGQARQHQIGHVGCHLPARNRQPKSEQRESATHGVLYPRQPLLLPMTSNRSLALRGHSRGPVLRAPTDEEVELEGCNKGGEWVKSKCTRSAHCRNGDDVMACDRELASSADSCSGSCHISALDSGRHSRPGVTVRGGKIRLPRNGLLPSHTSQVLNAKRARLAKSDEVMPGSRRPCLLATTFELSTAS